MSSSSEGHPGVGELYRQLQAVLTRFESISTRLDTQFVNKEFYGIDRRLIDETIASVRHSIAELQKLVAENEEDYVTRAELADVKTDVEELKDDKKWLYRLVIGALVLAAVSFAVSGGLHVGGG